MKEHGHGARNLRRPPVGDLALSFESFRLPDDPDQFLTVYHARPGPPAAAKLRLLIRRDAQVRSPDIR